MALLFCDGFDGYDVAADMLAAAGETGWVTVGGMSGSDFNTVVRSGYGQSLRQSSTTANKNAEGQIIEDPATVIMGIGFYATDNTGNAVKRVFSVTSGGAECVGVYLNTTGYLQVYVLGVLQTANLFLTSLSVWYYLELKVTVNNTGSWEFRVDGLMREQNASQDTQPGANAYADGFGAGSAVAGSMAYYLDDFYLCDDSGSYNNNFLGDVYVQTLRPNANGATVEFVPLSGTNYQMVDDPDQDGDTTYNSGSIVGEKDLYAFGNLQGTTNTILAVQQVAVMKKSDGTARTVQLQMDDSVNAEVDDGGGHTLESAYKRFSKVWNRDTAGAAWNTTKVNAIEAGVEIET